MYTKHVLERLLRGIFGPTGEEVTRGWRKLHNVELRNLYSTSNIIMLMESKRMRLAWHVAHMRRREIHKILVENPKGKIPLRISKSR
jgi:hypothetical protein